MRVLRQVYSLLSVSLLTAGVLGLVGAGIELLLAYGPLPLAVIIGILTAFLLVVMLNITLPFWIAWLTLRASKDPSPRRATQRAQSSPLDSDNTVPRENTQSVFEGLWQAMTLLYMFIYAALVTGLLILFFLFVQHTVPGYMPEPVVYATFGAEVIFFAVLFIRVLIKSRYLASRSA